MQIHQGQLEHKMPGVRHAAVAGAFYEDQAEDLRSSIDSSFEHRLGPGKIPEIATTGPREIIGLVCPHAGYHYSGAAAAWSYNALATDGRPELVIIFGTNHRLSGAPIALDYADSWATPLGKVPVDIELRERLKEISLIEEDTRAHEYEHSIEVQLPWLQYLYKTDFKICPISLGQITFKDIISLASELTEALMERDCLLIASTDFSHYVPHDTAEQLDRGAIQQIVAMNPQGLLNEVIEKRITMCGVTPVALMLVVSSNLGAKKVEQLTYYTSGDISGDKSAVVGYASLAVKR